VYRDGDGNGKHVCVRVVWTLELASAFMHLSLDWVYLYDTSQEGELLSLDLSFCVDYLEAKVFTSKATFQMMASISRAH
jgi:hypothetical protein